MYDLLKQSEGKNDLARLKDCFGDPKYEINVGQGTIDMMVFDTTAKKAYLSRGSSYKTSWPEFAFGAKDRASRVGSAHQH
jgi:hypothetical protein